MSEVKCPGDPHGELSRGVPSIEGRKASSAWLGCLTLLCLPVLFIGCVTAIGAMTPRPPAHYLGASREEVVAVLTAAGGHFDMEESTLGDGRQRSMSKTDQGGAALELIGAPDDLQSVAVIVPVPLSGGPLATMSGTLMGALVTEYAPAAEPWVSHQLRSIGYRKTWNAEQRVGNRKVSLSIIGADDGSLVCLTIEADHH